MRFRNLLAFILALLMVFALCACGGEEQEQRDKTEQTQTEDIAAMDLLTYRVLKKSVTYDPEGEIIQQITVEDNEDGLPAAATIEGERAGTVTYTYNGKYAVATLHYERADGDHTYYEFADFGDNLKKDTYKDGALGSVWTYSYDEGCRVADKTYTEPDNAKADKDISYTYKLNEQGLVIEELEFVNGKEYFIKEMQYDDQGREVRYSGAYIGREPYIRVSEYDDKGNMIKSTEYTGDVEDACTTFTYDDQGRLLKSVTMANGVEDAYEEYTYDVQGNVVKFSYYERSMGQRHYEYEYDQDGALSKESYFVKGELVRYTAYTWYDHTVSLEKNVALAINREPVVLKQ